MKTIKILDCANNEYYLNVDFIYKLTEIPISKKVLKAVVEIHLNHKDDNYTFSVIKTYESISSVLRRLEQYR